LGKGIKSRFFIGTASLLEMMDPSVLFHTIPGILPNSLVSKWAAILEAVPIDKKVV